MVRYTIALHGAPKQSSDDILLITEKIIEITQGEQLGEDYLLNVNPKGQVPTLTSPTLPKPLADSMVITYFLIERFPTLAPVSHKAQILNILEKLHAINYYSLTFIGKHAVANGMVKKIEDMISNNNISERYRKALEYKCQVQLDEKVKALDNGVPEHNQELATALLSECASLLSPAGPWLFGLNTPTALDAHLVTFLARLMDVGRTDCIPVEIREYAERAMAGEEWQRVTQGENTLGPKKAN